jgi:N-acetylmuramoyl-L-alanine amidase
MKKKFEILMITCLFASAFFLARAGAAFVSSKNAATAKDCIVLDAGHGGSDPGKVGINDALEKEINLAIVYKLKTMFENKGYKVVLTRTDDQILADENSSNSKVEDLRNRVALITETMPVMTISIHQNSFTDASISGPQVFFFEQSAEGETIAATLQDSLNTILEPENPRVSKSNDDYYILKKTPTPTVIVECGFLSNEAEAERLIDEAYQEKVARAIFQGACSYLNAQQDADTDHLETESTET